jgi:hypothetical protein
MKTLLNLLPEEKKREIERNVHGRFLLWQLFLSFFLEGFFVMILVGMFLILNFQVKSVETADAKNPERVDEAGGALRQYEDKFKGTNEAIEVIGRFDATHLHFTQVFRLLGTLAPEGIVLRDLSTTDKTVSLTGTARTREDIITFADRLKANACVSRANVPLSNLFSEENIDFQIDFDVTLDCLRKNSL